MILNLFKKKILKKKRSVVFYRHSYYHFYYLAEALRKRGWDAIVVNIEPIDGINADYYHEEHLNLYHKIPLLFRLKIARFYKKAINRFKLMHFAGDYCLGFFPESYVEDMPSDILRWRQKNKIAYTVSGCSSGVSQTSVSSWSAANNQSNMCDRCIWQENDVVCNNNKNLSWGKKTHQFCDLIFSETLPALDYMQANNKVIREPVTTCLDPDFWSPDLIIPSEYIVQKNNNEILIYHAVGNYELRNTTEKNIKGSPFIFKAIEQLKTEGHKIRLLFVTNKPNKVVRFYQAQADIIVDQLNAGRYGATAREGMMLGKPVICYINKFEYNDEDRLSCLDECPLVSASELEIYEELKKLVINSKKRIELGKKGREYALKWHSADACAERYERYYDQLFGE